MDEYDAAVAATRAALSTRPEVREFLRFATLAASGHNTQPWLFRVGSHRIEILPDFSRRTLVVDPDDHHLFASLGCAAENLALAAAARGQLAEINFDPANEGSVQLSLQRGRPRPSTLFNAIPHRQSTRAEYDGKSVSVADLKALARAAAVPGVDLVLITDQAQLKRVGELVVAGDSEQMGDPAFVTELKTWLRFNPRQALLSRDGLFSAASGSPKLPGWLGPFMFDQFFDAAAENDKYARQIRLSAGVAIFSARQEDRDHWVRAGRACQRFALQATALGLRHAFINQPVEVPRLRPELAALAGTPRRRPDIVMRFGHGPTLHFSARRRARIEFEA